MTSLATSCPPSTPIRPLAVQLQAHLERVGFQVEFDSDGDLMFRSEGLAYVLCLSPNDERWGRLLLPFVWDFDDESERDAIGRAIDLVNRRSQLVKAYTVHRRLHLSVPLLLEPVSASTQVLVNCIQSLAEARTLLTSAIRMPDLVALDLQRLAERAEPSQAPDSPEEAAASARPH